VFSEIGEQHVLVKWAQFLLLDNRFLRFDVNQIILFHHFDILAPIFVHGGGWDDLLQDQMLAKRIFIMLGLVVRREKNEPGSHFSLDLHSMGVVSSWVVGCLQGRTCPPESEIVPDHYFDRVRQSWRSSKCR
jgi:hypothetical protein